MPKLLRHRLRAEMACMALCCGVVVAILAVQLVPAAGHVGRVSRVEGRPTVQEHQEEEQQLWGGASCKCGCCKAAAPQNITVYNYLSIQGPNSTSGYNAVQCGTPTASQPNGFAQTFCFDMPLLLRQDLSSDLLGGVQGTYVFVSLSGSPATTLFVSESFTLNSSATPQGSFSASGLEYIGVVSSKPITGGTDAFAFLTGVATTTPLSNGVDSQGNLVSWFQYVFTFRPASC